MISTEGSQFDTHFKLYSGVSNAFQVSQLSIQSFAYNKGTDYRTRRIVFNAASNTTYYIQLDGGVQPGLVRLSWSQNHRPFIGMLPTNSLISAYFCLQLTNITPQLIRWIFNEQAMAGQSNLCFTLPQASSLSAGDYAVEITDTGGRVYRDKSYLRVLPISFAAPQVQETGVGLRFGTTFGRPVIVQSSSNLRDWTSIMTNMAPGATNEFIDRGSSADQRYYRFVLPP